MSSTPTSHRDVLSTRGLLCALLPCLLSAGLVACGSEAAMDPAAIAHVGAQNSGAPVPVVPAVVIEPLVQPQGMAVLSSPAAAPAPAAGGAPEAEPAPMAELAPMAEPAPRAANVPDDAHPDILRIADFPLSDVRSNPRGTSWMDSYSSGGRCYCATTFDHDIGRIRVETPAGELTVREVCDAIGDGPGRGDNPIYNDVQCGNGPANDAGDEDWCPGRVDIGKEGCRHIGPKWDLSAL